MPISSYKPKLFTLLSKKLYTKHDLVSDLTAGVIVGIVALPLAIAFAIASGVKPEQGLYTAVVAGFVIALLGGSRVQVSGPTGAFVVVVYGIVAQYGYGGLAAATFIAGLLLMAMGFAKAGKFLRFIPYPLTVGFTSGIAIIIFSSQVKDALGLTLENVPAGFVEKWMAFAGVFETANPYAAAVTAVSLLIILLWPRVTQRIPGSLIALIVVTAAVHALNIPVETIGTRFGSVPTSLPAPSLPSVSWTTIRDVFSPAITIALLAAIESLLSAQVADGMIGKQHRPNMELIAQGVGNVISPIFGGIPATGAIARTATNIKNGGRTPVSGVVHSIVLLLIMLFFGSWAALIPMPLLAAVLIHVAYTMSEWRTFVRLLKMPKGDVAILLTTFFLTVLIDLTVAIEVGVVLAAFLFMRQMANATQVAIVKRELDAADEEEPEDDKPITARDVPPGVEVFELHGSLFFAAVEQFRDAMRVIKERPKVLILRTRNLLTVDATGLNELEHLMKRTRQEGTHLLLSAVHKQPLMAMEQSGLLAKIGPENIAKDIDDALAKARELTGQPARKGWSR